MKQAKVAELKAKPSRYGRAADRGEWIEIVDRSRPIAQLGPLAPDVDDLELLSLIPFEPI